MRGNSSGWVLDSSSGFFVAVEVKILIIIIIIFRLLNEYGYFRNQKFLKNSSAYFLEPDSSQTKILSVFFLSKTCCKFYDTKRE